jgi:hypothetical protein
MTKEGEQIALRLRKASLDVGQKHVHLEGRENFGDAPSSYPSRLLPYDFILHLGDEFSGLGSRRIHDGVNSKLASAAWLYLRIVVRLLRDYDTGDLPFTIQGHYLREGAPYPIGAKSPTYSVGISPVNPMINFHRRDKGVKHSVHPSSFRINISITLESPRLIGVQQG